MSLLTTNLLSIDCDNQRCSGGINKLYLIHSKKNKLNSRVIVSYSFHKKEIVENQLVIRNSDNTYTSEYIKLTKDFHYNKL